MDRRIREAWQEIVEHVRRRARDGAEAGEDPQPRLAREFLASWEGSRGTPEGRRALGMALSLLGRTGTLDEVEAVLASLPPDSPDWASAVVAVNPAYHQAGRASAYQALLRRLEDELTHPLARSAVYTILGRGCLRSDPDRAAGYYRRVLELDASPFEMKQAEGALYELDCLGVGQAAPLFEAVTLAGETVRLADHRGRVVLLDFWATGCGPCWPELPHLRLLHDELPASDFALIGISRDPDEARLREVLEREGLRWPQVMEPTTWSDGVPDLGPVATLYNVWGIPRTVLIDREGRIAAKDLRGEKLVEEVRAAVG